MDVNELKSLFSRFRIRPDKRLGQNFLLSEKVLDQIIAAAELKPTDTVLEIGPGLGVLTQRLAREAGTVLAVEKDKKIYAALRKMFKSEKHVKIINDDALFMNLSTFHIPHSTFKIVANIPYYITGKLLQNFLSPTHNSPQPSLSLKEGVPPLNLRGGEGELFTRPSLMVLLLQKEVAERIVAKPGDMSLLSVSVQMYADPEIIAYVGKENFYPMPTVDSAVVRLRVLSRPRLQVDEGKFFQLVKIGFSNKRKQLQNNLRALPSDPNLRMTSELSEYSEHSDADSHHSDRYKQLLSSLGLNPLCRAQDLSLEDWEKLYKKLF